MAIQQKPPVIERMRMHSAVGVGGQLRRCSHCFPPFLKLGSFQEGEV